MKQFIKFFWAYCLAFGGYGLVVAGLILNTSSSVLAFSNPKMWQHVFIILSLNFLQLKQKLKKQILNLILD